MSSVTKEWKMDRVVVGKGFGLSFVVLYDGLEEETTNSRYIGFRLHDTYYYLECFQNEHTWKPAKVYHEHYNACCPMCQEEILIDSTCTGFQEQIDDFFEKLYPKIRLKLLFD